MISSTFPPPLRPREADGSAVCTSTSSSASSGMLMLLPSPPLALSMLVASTPLIRRPLLVGPRAVDARVERLRRVVGLRAGVGRDVQARAGAVRQRRVHAGFRHDHVRVVARGGRQLGQRLVREAGRLRRGARPRARCCWPPPSRSRRAVDLERRRHSRRRAGGDRRADLRTREAGQRESHQILAGPDRRQAIGAVAVGHAGRDRRCGSVARSDRRSRRAGVRRSSR